MRGWLFSSVKFLRYVYASKRKKERHHFVALRIVFIFIGKYQKFEKKGTLKFSREKLRTKRNDPSVSVCVYDRNKRKIYQ